MNSARILRRAVVVVCGVALASPAWATNGMNMIGYGAVSSSMGGADLALVDNASAMNINPAGICECASPQLEGGLSLLMPSLSRTDDLGNDGDATDQVFPLPYLAYVHPLGRWHLGVGLFAQGGMGAEYEELTTPMFANFTMMGGVPAGQAVPVKDETYTNVMYAKLTPTVAYRVSPRFTVGASLQLGYAAADLKFFPDTSVFGDFMGNGTSGDQAGEAFFGMDMDGLSSFGYGARLGFQYKFGALTVGGAYLSPTTFDFDDGTMTLNLAGMGLGKVDYDAKMDGFDWPQQVGFGMSYRIASWLLLAADVDWVDWSSAVETVEVKVTNPDNALAPATMTFPFQMDWKDQWVFAVGAEIRPSLPWAIRLGYNHGNSPVPNDTVTPLFPAITEDHVTAGVGYAVGAWGLDAGVEYAFEAEQTNDNPNGNVNPFGPGSTEKHAQLTTHLSVRHSF